MNVYICINCYGDKIEHIVATDYVSSEKKHALLKLIRRNEIKLIETISVNPGDTFNYVDKSLVTVLSIDDVTGTLTCLYNDVVVMTIAEMFKQIVYYHWVSSG